MTIMITREKQLEERIDTLVSDMEKIKRASGRERLQVRQREGSVVGEKEAGKAMKRVFLWRCW